VTRVRSRRNSILIAGAVALALSLVALERPGGSEGAATAARGSSNVAVIPGFAPKPYPHTHGVPRLPRHSPQLSPYTFTDLPANQVTSAALSSYDTVFLYGIRWGDIPSTGQAAINAFAATHKVVIWDADDTGAQAYSNFVHPFSTQSSGEGSQGGASVVSYPAIANVLASDAPASPYFLDPNELVNDQHMINHMNAMTTGTQEWVPAIAAANWAIPNGGWVLAWSYGTIGDATGLVVYSGIDSDGLISTVKPNYALTELALDLAAPFSQTPAPCAPNCTLPTDSGGGITYAACSFAKRIPTHWVRGRVPILLRTSIAAGITGQVQTSTGNVIARGREKSGALVRFVVWTKKLPSNQTSRLKAVIFVKGQHACTTGFRLKVDNVPPRLLSLSTRRTARAHLLGLRVSENSSISVVTRAGYVALSTPSGRRIHRPWVRIAANSPAHLRVSSTVKTAKLIVRDRAGNTVVRRLAW
jgi:hypothetical protein